MYNIDDLRAKMGPTTRQQELKELEDRNKLIVQLHQEGYTFRQIGKVFGITGARAGFIYHELTSQRYRTN